MKLSITLDELPEITDKGTKCPFCEHIMPHKKFNQRKFLKLAKELQKTSEDLEEKK